MQSLKSLPALLFLISVQTGYTSAGCGVTHTVSISKFGYTPSDGPLTWHHTPGNELCSQGTHQTPILLDNSIRKTDLGNLALSVGAMDDPLLLENKGTTVEVPNAELALVFDPSVITGLIPRPPPGPRPPSKRNWTLKNYHFHTPSEHRVDLEHSPVEMHMVFQDPLGQRAVLGFMIELSGDPSNVSEFLRKSLYDVSCIATPGEGVHISLPPPFIEIVEFVSNTSFYLYDGRLTTPPCSEKIEWFVGTRKLYLDVDTYNALKLVVKFNSRFTQNPIGAKNIMQEACAS